MHYFVAAIALGFLGSLHCIGMCGPIALALPVHHFKPFKKQVAILLYQTGRLTTYSLIGLLFGLLGQTFFPAAFQQGLSIGIGILILLTVTVNRVAIYRPKISIPLSKVKFKLAALFKKRGLRFLFFIGLLNGLLPCGLVYLGIAGATASGNYKSGALFMLFFGLGTLPAMYIVANLGQFISTPLRNKARKAMPVIVTTMALLLILRGLNLGIPYLSPAIEKKNNRMNCCVKKNRQCDSRNAYICLPVRRK